MNHRLATATIGCLAAIFVSCGAKAPEPLTVRHNSDIDAKTQAQIQLLNTRLVNGFLENDPTAMRELFVDEVRTEIESGPGLVPTFDKIRAVLTDTTIVPFYEFDITPGENPPETLEIPAEGDRGFSLSLVPGTHRRMHVSLIEARSGARDHLLGMIWVGDGNTWRLQSLRVGGLRIDGRNALEWYGEALRLSEQGEYMPAAMRLMVARGLLQPIPFMHYDNESVVRELERSVSAKLAESHAFPLELSALPGKPSVIRLEPVFQKREFLTLVSYVTGQKLEQAAVDAEVPKIQRALTEMFPGMCRGSRRVAYKAFAEPPTDPQKTYSFINAVAACEPPAKE